MFTLYYIFWNFARVKMMKLTKKFRSNYDFMQIVNKITKI